jgi:hypothetical protein
MTAAGYLELGLGESPGPAPYGYVRFYVDEDGAAWLVNDADNAVALTTGLVKVDDAGTPDYLSPTDFEQDEDDHITLRDGAVTAAKLAADIDASAIGFNAQSVGGLSAADLALADHGHTVADLADLSVVTRSSILFWRSAEWTNASAGTLQSVFGDRRTSVRFNKADYPANATYTLRAIAKSDSATDSVVISLTNVADDVPITSGAAAITDSYGLVESADLAADLPDGDVDVYLRASATTGTLSLWGVSLEISG